MNTRAIPVLVAGAGLAASAALATSIPFSCAEPLKRSWSNEVLNIVVQVPVADCDLAAMYVTDEAGAVIPAQVSDARFQGERQQIPVTVSLVASFEPWQERRWVLHAGEEKRPAIPETDLRVSEEKGVYVLSNSRIAVRVPKGGETFKKPEEAGRAPAPILAVRGPSGKWIGRGWLESPIRVTGYTAALTHDGPVFKRVRSTYRFDGGRYTCDVTLRTGEDVIHVRDEFDLGDPAKERDSNFCFSLKDGLDPDTVRWYGRYYNKKFNQAAAAAASYDQREASFAIDYATPERLLRLHGLFVWWPEAACYWGAYRQADPQSDLVAVFPERPGHWRNPAATFLETGKDRDLVMRFPIRQPVQDWGIDGVDYGSPYFTGSVAPDVPRTLGVREWGMLVTKAAGVIPEKDDFTKSGIRQAWTRYGQNPLDKIKDWTLRWSEPGAAAYPRGAIKAAELPALRDRVARIPDLKAMVGSPQHRFFTYLANPDPTNGAKMVGDLAGGDANWMGILPKLRNSAGYYLDQEGDIGIHTFMHHGIGNVAGSAPLFDVAMSVPTMTAEERREAMALYAFCLYKLADPDWLAYGAGFHLGNPNMPTTALSQLGVGAALVPEHPMASEWMMRSVKSTLTMLRDYVAPGGAWRECPHYQLDASMAGILHSGQSLRNGGFLDLFQNANFKATMLYNLQLLTPVDPRFGIRTVPAIGNGTHETTSLYGRMAAGTAGTDPTYSKWMQWGWQAVGKPYLYANDEMICNEDLPAAMPEMTSRHFPGFGAVMRSHVGNASESYVIFRMGKQHEHYEIDQGNLVFYAKGVPLVLDFGSQYQPMFMRPWLHNRVSFDHMVDEFTQTGEITESAFLGAADAALGRVTISKLFEYPEDPAAPMPPNMAPPSKAIKPTTWTRQVMLVKHEQGDGPEYVLLRDGFEGAGDQFTESTLWCLAKAVSMAGGMADFAGQLGVDLAVTQVEPAKPEFTTGKMSHNFIGPTAGFWRKINGTNKFEETQHFIRTKRSDHKGYFAVLYPHRQGEASPAFAPWGQGAGVTATVAGEKQTAICAEQPGAFSEGGVVFEGQRALVREGNGRLVLALLAGKRLEAGGCSVSAPGPVSVTVAADKVVGEACLPEAGEVVLVCPGVAAARSVVVTVGGKESSTALAREGQSGRLPLPAGLCQFRLE